MLTQLKAGGVVVALIGATAGLTALGGTVAVTADRVDPDAVIHLSNSPSPSISPPVPLKTFQPLRFADRKAAEAALAAPSGYSVGTSTSDAKLVTQIEGAVDATKAFTVSGCAFFLGQRKALISCTGELTAADPPQLVEHLLLGVDRTVRDVGHGVLVSQPMPDVSDPSADAVSVAGSKDESVVLGVLFYPAGPGPDDATLSGLVGELLGGLHA